MASASVSTCIELQPEEELRMSGEYVQGYFPSSSLSELSVDIMPFCSLLSADNLRSILGEVPFSGPSYAALSTMTIRDLCACEFVQGSHSALLRSKFRCPKKLIRMHCPMPRNGGDLVLLEKILIVGRWTRVYVALTFSWQDLADFWPFSAMCLDGSRLFWRTMPEEVTLRCVMCQSTAVILQGAEQKDSEVSISRCSRLSSHTYSMHVNSYKYVYAYRSPIVCLFMPMAACSLLNSIITRIHTSYPYTADLDLGLGGDFQFPAATAPGAAALGVVLLADFLGFLPVCGCACGLGAKKCC